MFTYDGKSSEGKQMGSAWIVQRQQKSTAWHCTHFTFKVPVKRSCAQNHNKRWKVDSLW